MIYLFRNSQQEGPYSIDQIRAQLKSGILSMNDAAWMEGWDEWKKVSDVPNLLAAEPPSLPVQVIVRESVQPAAKKKIVDRTGSWCPHCGCRNSYRKTEGFGCILIVILLITIIGIIFIPFLPKTWHCRECKHTWK